MILPFCFVGISSFCISCQSFFFFGYCHYANPYQIKAIIVVNNNFIVCMCKCYVQSITSHIITDVPLFVSSLSPDRLDVL